MRPIRPMPECPKDKLKELAKELGISFTTAAKAYEARGGKWRDCEVRGVRVRDELRKRL